MDLGLRVVEERNMSQNLLEFDKIWGGGGG